MNAAKQIDNEITVKSGEQVELQALQNLARLPGNLAAFKYVILYHPLIKNVLTNPFLLEYILDKQSIRITIVIFLFTWG